jgi:hypothetical protein
MPTFNANDKRRLVVAVRNPETGEKLGAALDAIEAENTDVEIAIEPLNGLSDDATVVWTRGVTSAGVRTMTRTAGSTASGLWFPIPTRIRSGTDKGLKPTGVKMAYSVGTATLTDIRTELYKRTIPAAGAAPGTPQLIAGQTNSEYVAAYNTAAERSAIASHTSQLTVPTAAQAYLAADEQLLLKVYVDPAASSVVVLKDIALLASEALVDES